MVSPKAKKVKVSGYPVVCQPWVESERGWGQKPDGYSLHLDQNALDSYLKADAASKNGPVPEVYERPEGRPYNVIASDAVYKQLKKAKGSFRSYDDAPQAGAFLK